MGGRWKIAEIRGIPLYVGTSWLLIAGIYVWGQYVGLTEGFARETPGTALMLAVLTGVLFFGSVLLHEAAHAATARALDIPVTGITLVFWGGATETRASARGPLGEFLIAFVGPATTLLMGGVFWVATLGSHGTIHDIFGYLAELSLYFAALNTLPGFPLDGGRMLLATVWGITHSRRTALRVAGYVGVAVGVALFGVGAWQLLRGNTFFAIFAGYVGAIMFTTGRGMDQRIALRDQLSKGTAADAMRAPPPSVPADMTLAQTLDHVLRANPSQAFPVVAPDGAVMGTISMNSARRPGARDPMRPARDALIPLNQTPAVEADETLDDALEWLSGRDGLVLRDGKLVGALGAADVERWYRRVIEGRVIEDADTAPIPPRPDR
jgi:Zn-dependent protease/predicted transcriptional regulator